MNKRMKQILMTGLVMVGLGAVSQAATTDTMTVSVSPLVTYSVVISSPYSSGYNFSNVSLGATTLSTLGITLNTTGSTAPEYFGLSISNTSGGWTSTLSAPGQDTFRMGAKIAASQPLMSNTTDFLTQPAWSGPAAGLYSQPVTPVAGSAKVWLRLEMPTSLNAGTIVGQTMTMTATAVGS